MFAYPRTRQRSLLPGLLALALAWLWLIPAPDLRAAIAPAGAASMADIVVQFGDGSVVTKRIAFTGTITGLEALRLAGLPLVEKNGGVCRIGDTGCGAEEECFCACPPPFTPCLFWSYQRWSGGAWVSSAQGAGSTTVADGAVEGWTWGRALPAVTPALLGAQAGLDWLRPLQGLDGSYANGNVGLTVDTILANRALGGDADAWRRDGGSSLLDALAARAPAYAALGVAQAGKLAIGVAAADQDPRDFVGLNLVISMTAALDQQTGAYGSTNWDQALAILGLRAAREPVPAAAVALLRSRAQSDGSWGFTAAGAGDVDSTGLALQALSAAGVPASDPAVVKALDYLDAAQNSDGGFPYAPEAGGGDTSNANSTALAIQGIVAAGGEPLDARWRPAAADPVAYILSQQQGDGAFTFGGQASLLATQQVIPALAGRSLPFAGRAGAQRAALDFIAAQQQDDGSFAGFGVGATLDAILAIAAAGGSPENLRSSSGQSALDYLRPRAAAYAAGSAAAAGKLVVAVVAAGEEPRVFGGLNLVISTTLRYDPGSGAFGSSIYDQAWSILGLAAAGETIPVSATERLQAIASPGGGWGFSANDAAPDPDSTGLALMALAAAGVGRARIVMSTSATSASAGLCAMGPGSANPAVLAALGYLRGAINPDGGFPGFGGPTSASSTGLALQGLAAYHEAPRSLTWGVLGGGGSDLTITSPLDALLDLQTAEGGFPGFGGPNDPGATYQALPGLIGASFPSSTRARIFLPGVIGG